MNLSATTHFPSLVMTDAEWVALCRILGFAVPAPGERRTPSRRAVEEGRAALQSRNIVSGNRVNADVAAVLFSLAHPRTACWVHGHRSTKARAYVAANRRVCALLWADGDDLRVAPSLPGHVGHDLAVLSGLPAEAAETAPTVFSVAGGLWHELVTQAPVASMRALESLAAAEGVPPGAVPTVSALAAAHTGRMDLRLVRPKGRRTWSGNEVSLVNLGSQVWSIADGRAFDETGSRATSRATFTLVDPRELLSGLVSP